MRRRFLQLTCMVAAAAAVAYATAAPPVPPIKIDAASRPGVAGVTPTPVEPVSYPLHKDLAPAAKARLAAERKNMSQELLDNALWDPAQIEKAVKALNEGAIDAPDDNFRRFTAAVEKLHPEFAKPYATFKLGRWEDASKEFADFLYQRVEMIKARRSHNKWPPFEYSIAKFMEAEALARQGSLADAVVAYQVVYYKMPDALTFAAAARHRVALIYEQTNRGHYAIPLYEENLIRHGRWFTPEHRRELQDKIAALKAADPFLLAEAQAAEAVKRLREQDTGDETQALQKKLMESLNNMLILAESEDRPFLEHTDAISMGADSGKLQKGGTPKLSPLGEDPPKTGSDDWGQLRPREKQQLLEAFRAQYPDRYRDMLEAYYRNLSAKENGNGGGR